MRKALLSGALVLAYFTGRSEMVTTVTGKAAMKCQYEYSGTKFWRLFPGLGVCPMSVEIE
jgi:hypothetical protein